MFKNDPALPWRRIITWQSQSGYLFRWLSLSYSLKNAYRSLSRGGRIRGWTLLCFNFTPSRAPARLLLFGLATPFLNGLPLMPAF